MHSMLYVMLKNPQGSCHSAKFLIGKLPSRCQDQRLRVALRVVDALQRSNDLKIAR